MDKVYRSVLMAVSALLPWEFELLASARFIIIALDDDTSKKKLKKYLITEC